MTSDKRDPAIRITLLPRDTNSAGTVFGGVILSYIDMAGAIEAHRRTGMARFVTVSIGNTSITIRVIVETERVGSSKEQVRVTEAEVVYVAVNAMREKTPIKR